MSAKSTASSSSSGTTTTIGVMGGSFNPIHLGHALLAVTAQQTFDLNEVVVVPFHHDDNVTNNGNADKLFNESKCSSSSYLLPIDDRIAMCELAFEDHREITVSRLGKTSASYGIMLKRLKAQYSNAAASTTGEEVRFVWIASNDFCRWIHVPRGLEILMEVHGVILQRLQEYQPQQSSSSSQADNSESRLRRIASQMNLSVDVLPGRLPAFSSATVLRAPGHWRSFLTDAVSQYLEERPSLWQRLLEDLRAAAVMEEDQAVMPPPPPPKKARRQRSLSLSALLIQSQQGLASTVLLALEMIHLLQKERGLSALYLSMGNLDTLQRAQGNTDRAVQKAEPLQMVLLKSSSTTSNLLDFDHVRALASELQRVPQWLSFDRQVLEKHAARYPYVSHQGPDDWFVRWGIVKKFNARIDVLMEATLCALTEILRYSQSTCRDDHVASHAAHSIPELFQKWSEGKESLGRERAYISCGGPAVPVLVKASVKLRELTTQVFHTKERKISHVYSTTNDKNQFSTTPDLLFALLEQLTCMEYAVLGVFPSGIPVARLHRLMASGDTEEPFDVLSFFEASTAAIDFLLTSVKVLTVSALVSA